MGTTVVAASLALVLGRTHPDGALLVDLAGDVPAVLGIDDTVGPGVAGWLDGDGDVPIDGLARLERPLGAGLSLLPRGRGPLDPRRADVLASLLAGDRRSVVADVGVLDLHDGMPVASVSAATEVGVALAGAAVHSLLVLRPCYVGLRRAVRSRLRPSGVVLVHEEGRVLTGTDVEGALGVPVQATVRVTEHVARTVDAGLLHRHLPRSLARDLRHVPVPCAA